MHFFWLSLYTALPLTVIALPVLTLASDGITLLDDDTHIEDCSVTPSLSDSQLLSLVLDATYIDNESQRTDKKAEEKRDEPLSDKMSDGEYAKGMIYRSSHYSTTRSSRTSTNKSSRHRNYKQQHMGTNRVQRLQRRTIT